MIKHKYRIIVDTKDERGILAGILVKNGYSVTPGKQLKKDSNKSYDYYLEVCDEEDRNVYSKEVIRDSKK